MIDRIRQHRPAATALVSCGENVRWSYRKLLEAVESNRAAIDRLPRPALATVFARNQAGCVAAYLAGLAARLPMALLDPDRQRVAQLAETYRASAAIMPKDEPPLEGFFAIDELAAGYRLDARSGNEPFAGEIHAQLQLLLSTSGSTGSAKLVRLAAKNLAANAESIAAYLELSPAERSMQSLPLQYSYGLSLINSHLWSGGTVVLTPHSFLWPGFWKDFDGQRGTSFAGVPYMYQTLHRLKFDPARHPTLRTMTQAGGGLRTDLVDHFHRLATDCGARLVVMYGQTEATARIAYVPPDRLPAKIGSIGVAIPGGRLWLEPVEAGDQVQDELVYSGPNVMLGYAQSAADLARGDDQQGVIRTGDLGRVDGDGFFYITGRRKRFAKIFGSRVSLEDVEDAIERQYQRPAAAIEEDGRLRLFVEWEMPDDRTGARVRQYVAELLRTHPSAIEVTPVDALPRTASGKKIYHQIQ